MDYLLATFHFIIFHYAPFFLLVKGLAFLHPNKKKPKSKQAKKSKPLFMSAVNQSCVRHMRPMQCRVIYQQKDIHEIIIIITNK